MNRTPEPFDGNERDLLLGWLDFHRDALLAKCDRVSDTDLVRTGLGGSAMSLLGLVRHLTEMERVYLVKCLGGGALDFVYGPYDDGQPAGDFDGLTPDMVDASFERWRSERAAGDALIRSVASMDQHGKGSTRSLRSCVLKLLQEYARHNGQADLIRESIDGATGE